jgi:hypothetical protein
LEVTNAKVEFIKAVETAFSKVREAAETTITLFVPELKASGVDRAWMTRQIAIHRHKRQL